MVTITYEDWMMSVDDYINRVMGNLSGECGFCDAVERVEGTCADDCPAYEICWQVVRSREFPDLVLDNYVQVYLYALEWLYEFGQLAEWS